MINPNSYDSYFEKESDDLGYITLCFENGQSVEVSPFETEDGTVLYEVEPGKSDLSIYDVAKLCKCEVVLVHIKFGNLWDGDIEIIKRTPQEIETLYEVSSYGAHWHCRSKYIVYSSIEEIKEYYLEYSKKILSEIELPLPDNIPFNSSQYIKRIGDIIEHKIANEWGIVSPSKGYFDSNFQYVPQKKIKLPQLSTYSNKKLFGLLTLLDDIESQFEFEHKELKAAKFILIGTSDVKGDNLFQRKNELLPLTSECLSVYDEYSNGETPHKCFLAMSPL